MTRSSASAPIPALMPLEFQVEARDLVVTLRMASTWVEPSEHADLERRSEYCEVATPEPDCDVPVPTAAAQRHDVHARENSRPGDRRQCYYPCPIDTSLGLLGRVPAEAHSGIRLQEFPEFGITVIEQLADLEIGLNGFPVPPPLWSSHPPPNCDNNGSEYRADQRCLSLTQVIEEAVHDAYLSTALLGCP
ncbi:hypothetical protein FDH00_gp62 [Gordonia phage Attis]|uniref:Uncharacterized protein n=2 Tax=Attisvirus attis TaxID=2169707 RepID=A0A142K8V4_9CAUD|nr:hypothetical protein SEA_SOILASSASSIN_62 [Gordonia phage SoilAssassin]YP_009595820.1 hypothetical protein FDH00_gp62 [Gordonia phage Attis]AMS02463.1 hypothetical protein SEA_SOILASSASSIN_62 [Gordonia phage SoilAssassin]AMS02537.1 hypothetical protein SEA_ATTIS_62 [Gordonia phage Attis]